MAKCHPGRLERLARRGGIAGKITAHGATILFVAVTSVLFFDGVSKIFPFIYASQSPLPSGPRAAMRRFMRPSSPRSTGGATSR